MSSLLPGLREVRAPLATGYVWLVVLWLALADTIAPTSGRPAGFLGDLYELAERVGPAVTLAAATFVAYVVGVLSVEATAFVFPVLRLLRRRRLVADGSRRGTSMLSSAGHAALTEAVIGVLAQRCDSDPALADKLERTREACGESRGLDDPAVRRELLKIRVDVDRHTAEVEADLPLMPLRILAQGRADQIFGEFDRFRAEAEFRASVAVPIAALIVVAAVQVSPWFLLALVAPVHLEIEARRNVSAASDVLAEYVRACPTESPVLTSVSGGVLHLRDNWLEKAADEGYTAAMVAVAQAAEEQDTDEAERWYRRAAEEGDGAAALWLAGRLHRRGDGEAKRWYDRAADAGDPVALEIREAEAAADDDEVNVLKLAHAGDPAAMTALGDRMIELGAQDAAVDWYRRAAGQGHVPAISRLVSHLESKGNIAAAEQWQRRLSGVSATPPDAPVKT